MSFRCVVYSSYPKDVKFNGAYGSSRPEELYSLIGFYSNPNCSKYSFGYQSVGIRITKRDAFMWVKEKGSTNRLLFGAISTKLCH